MAHVSENQGVANDLVRQAAERTGSIASWLDDREPVTCWTWSRASPDVAPGASSPFASPTSAAGPIGELLFAVGEDVSLLMQQELALVKAEGLPRTTETVQNIPDALTLHPQERG
ncbi:MAG: hypothetical protein WBQ44_15225 [Rhodococcus sp. (in: high G+C Gram-positive bacteria)]